MTRGPRKLRLIFGSASLTHYGGVYLLHRFFSRLRLKKLLTQQARLIQRNNRYSVGEMLLALLYPMILGLERIETAQLLRQNGVFQYLTGLPSYPDATTLRRFLLRIAPVALAKAASVARSVSLAHDDQPHRPTRLIFDVDSTVLVVYGQQEQARRGYNPIKRSRPSYHPLLCFEGQSKDFWHWRVAAGRCPYGQRDTRPAHRHAWRNSQPESGRSSSAPTKGFTIMRWSRGWKSIGPGFVIVARLTAPIKRKLAHLRFVIPSRGSRGRRIPLPADPVAPRLSLRRRPTATARGASRATDAVQIGQISLPGPGHQLPLHPLNLWRFYNDRAGIELLIRQLKGDYALGSIPTRHFFANETYFHLLLLAYNLVNWFKRLCLPDDLQNATLQTLRHRFS